MKQDIRVLEQRGSGYIKLRFFYAILRFNLAADESCIIQSRTRVQNSIARVDFILVQHILKTRSWNMVHLLKQIGVFVLIILLSSQVYAATEQAYQAKFIQAQLAKGYTRDQIDAFLKPAKKNALVLKTIRRPWEAQPWYKYYPIFLTEKRIQAGVTFWKKHQKAIEKAEKEFQVDAEFIVSIIGVETFYGRNMGSFNTRDALYSLGFYYPPRSKLFLAELGSFMDLVEKEKLDPAQVKGSYAGAMGYGQFISSSYLHYAVDFNADGKRDLYQPVDAIGSVANYLKQHHWKWHAPVVYPAQIKNEKDVQNMLWKKEKPTMTVQGWSKYGVALDKENLKHVAAQDRALLFKLNQNKTENYWLGLNNFYVITRYNHSQLYAMAVYKLSQSIKQAYLKSLP